MPPPKRAEKFLQWFIRDDLVEEALGDLEEKYYETLDKKTPLKAKFNYWYQVLNYLRPFAIKKSAIHSFIHFPMFRHNFLISYRSLRKNKGYSLLNIGGLAMGMTVAILISLWVWDELSFNQYHQNYDRIAQIMRAQTWKEEKFTSPYQVSALGTLLKDSYNHYFEKVEMARRAEEHIITFENHSFTQLGNFMQSGMPEMLTLNMIHGNSSGLTDMNTILISQTLANKLFADASPINKTVTIDGKAPAKIIGVYEDIPHNSAFWGSTYIAPLDLYFSMSGQSHNTWTNQNMMIYAQLLPEVNIEEASLMIKDQLKNHIDEEAAATQKPELFLHPMSKWHLYSEFENGINVMSNQLKYVWFYSIIGFFVLLLACINFMNLSTARSEKRAKEIGIRKSVGSTRYQLIKQFLSESTFLSILSFIITLGVVHLALPWFNQISGKGMVLPFSKPFFWIACMGFTIFTGLLAGSYPALHLSSFNPVKSLKGTFKIKSHTIFSRKGLVVFQFAISIALIIGTIIVYQQIQFAKNRSVGYSQEGLLTLPKRVAELYGKYEVFREELKKTGAVLEIAEANYPLTNTRGSNDGFIWKGKAPDFDPSFNTIRVNHEYGKTVDWKLLEGRDFSRERSSDASSVIITKSAKRLMDFENPIGETITFTRDYFGGPDFTIIGVVDDMLKASPFESPHPAIMFLAPKEQSWMFLRLNPQFPVNEALATIESTFEKIVPSAPFDYEFIDQAYSAKFKSEEQVGMLATLFASLAIFISCLGLFGLVAFVAEQRTKEIGIRKVLGASMLNLWQLLSKDFLVLVSISFFIAMPVAYYFMHEWLQNYEYRTEIYWWIFALAGIGSLIITLITVSYQAIKVASSNPVETLRTE